MGGWIEMIRVGSLAVSRSEGKKGDPGHRSRSLVSVCKAEYEGRIGRDKYAECIDVVGEGRVEVWK